MKLSNGVFSDFTLSQVLKSGANHPLGRIANANDYKGTAVYLASEASSFMTGTLITVDGGKTAK